MSLELDIKLFRAQDIIYSIKIVCKNSRSEIDELNSDARMIKKNLENSLNEGKFDDIPVILNKDYEKINIKDYVKKIVNKEGYDKILEKLEGNQFYLTYPFRA